MSTPLDKLPPQPHFGTYLAAHVGAGIIDFAVRAKVEDDGSVAFYIRPAHVSGRTEDYQTQANRPEVFNTRGLDALLAACGLSDQNTAVSQPGGKS